VGAVAVTAEHRQLHADRLPQRVGNIGPAAPVRFVAGAGERHLHAAVGPAHTAVDRVAERQRRVGEPAGAADRDDEPDPAIAAQVGAGGPRRRADRKLGRGERHRPALRPLPHRLRAHEGVVGKAVVAVVVDVVGQPVEAVRRLDPHRLALADEDFADQRRVVPQQVAVGAIEAPLAVLAGNAAQLQRRPRPPVGRRPRMTALPGVALNWLTMIAVSTTLTFPT
jgi:hypothetical protein